MTEFGVGTYTRNIVRALGRLDSESSYFLIGPPEKVAEIGSLPANFQSVPLLGNDTTVRSYFDFRAILNRLGCDLVHIPHLFWLPRNLPCPYVMTVHDLLEHMYRARDQSGLRRSLHFFLTQRALKGVVRIIEAFSALKAELEKENLFPGLKLIIIGDELSKHPDLRRTVVRSRMQNDVRFMGFVPIEVLRIFYDAAKIFVFPSLYEGFGLPPLEAMAHGTPVVTSNTSSLPEVVGNAAVLVNPENVFEIMRALHRVLLDQALRDKLKERGYQQATRFSWDASAQQILCVYHEVSEKRPARPQLADERIAPRAANS